MKRLIEDVEGEGLVSLMGQRITLFCVNYIYTGKLVGVNDSDVKLTDSAIVYETGPFTDTDWADAQQLPNDVYVRTSAIESYCVLK
jgi:hypothetical protein